MTAAEMGPVHIDFEDWVARVREAVESPPPSAQFIVHPSSYKRALGILGLPEDHRLTYTEFAEAAAIEHEREWH